jgi:hypothetical protein
MKWRHKEWEEEKEELKKDKKKTECALFDLLKVSDANKEKVKKIKAILEE